MGFIISLITNKHREISFLSVDERERGSQYSKKKKNGMF